MTNRLVDETSPYLLQHAGNPVDWYPWGPEALSRAKEQDRPILLSVGYAACHWCHVMEEESFEDEATAALMNEHFVCIKVDREERPDIDGIYMDAVQAMTGRGGWPMTVFLTPDGAPFYAGTYFPNRPRHGMPSFTRVLTAIAETWRDRREDARDQAGRVAASLERATHAEPEAEPLTEQTLSAAHAALAGPFDPEWGGFGDAPKFPPAMTLEFLLRCHVRGYDGSLDMVRLTLDAMASGGVADQIGGGFHRYAVDRRWHVPHFEKMLYDNALLARVYTRASLVAGDERSRDVATGTVDYLLREMRHASGGFFSSQDADSGGTEGAFFVWDWDDLVAAVGVEVATYFGALPEGNWEGTNILWTPESIEGTAGRIGADPERFRTAVLEARETLFRVREQRVRPATDDKILSAWNGLAITALSEAGMVFEEPSYVEAAVAAAEFILAELLDPQGRLLRSWRDGRAGRPGYAEDYALLADGLLSLYEATGETRFFEEGRRLCDELIRLFADDERGGFYQTGVDAERLVIRPKDLVDNAVPSGNSAAALVLQRLSLFTGDDAYERHAVRALRLVRDHMVRAPTGFGHALAALDMVVGPAREIAIVGDGSASAAALIRTVWSRYVPNRVLAVTTRNESASPVPLLRGRSLVSGASAAYVCERFVCERPVSDPDALASLL